MRMSYSTRVRLAVPVLAATALIVVSGCSDDGGHDMDSMTSHSMPDSATAAPSTADDSAEFNDADVAFASDMYPHHAQAVEMAQLVTGRSSNPDIVSLAGAIKAAQAPRWISCRAGYRLGVSPPRPQRRPQTRPVQIMGATA